MKRPIKNSQLLFCSSIFSIVAFLLAANFIYIEQKPDHISRPAEDLKPLKLTHKTLVKRQDVSPFSSVRIATQFLDTVIFEPSNDPHVEIKGDQLLVNNLRFYHQTLGNELVIERNLAFWVDSLRERAYYDFNFTGVLEKGGLNIKIYYKELKDISIYGEAKFIEQKGTLRDASVFIEACAEEARFHVETKNLELYLSKPCFWVDSLGHTIKHRPDSFSKGFQTFTGKADLVQINPRYGTSWADLSKLKCRHVHCGVSGGGNKKIIAAPSQLFSYFGAKPLPLEDGEIICKSKAKVIYAYEDPQSRRTHTIRTR